MRISRPRSNEATRVRRRGATRRARWALAGLLAALAASAVVARVDATGIALAAAALTAAAATLGPEVLSWLREREATDNAQQQQLRELLVRWPLSVYEADQRELGVPESRIANQYRREREQCPPYVTRDQDNELRRALAEHSFVMLVGPSKAGKSRTAVEALFSEECGLRHRTLIVPVRPGDNAGALRGLTALRPALHFGPEPAVLWLDDLDEFLRAGALSATLLRQWREEQPRAIVLATIREGALADLRALESARKPSDGAPVGKAIGEVLDQAEQVDLPRSPSHDELERASEFYPGQDFRCGIGTSLIDAPRLVDRLRTGRSRCPEGVAVVRSAVDWRRMGVIRRATKDDLLGLVGLYLEEAQPSSDMLDRGLDWAQERLESGAALLRHAGEGPSYEAHDYIVEFTDGRALGTDRREEIPRAAWDDVIDRIGAEDAVAVGFSAYTQPSPVFAAAEKAWNKATRSGDPNAVPMAWFYLGALYTRKERLAQAENAYRRAVQSQHRDAAPQAAVTLGVLLEGKGQEREAESAYRQAIASDHPDAAPRAAAVLGLLLAGQPGREAEAEAAYRQALASGHAGAAAMAGKYLPRLREPAQSRRGAPRSEHPQSGQPVQD